MLSPKLRQLAIEAGNTIVAEVLNTYTSDDSYLIYIKLGDTLHEFIAIIKPIVNKYIESLVSDK